MFDDQFLYRGFVLLHFAVTNLVEAYYRFRSQVPGQRLRRREEGLVSLVALRLLLAARIVTLLVFVVRPAWLDWSVMPLDHAARMIGMVLSLGGTATMAWVFQSLGRNLTDTVVTREEATLVTRGPYRFVRHPLYLSFALATVAETLVTANWLVGVMGILILALLAARTGIEEARLLDKFGDDYVAYQRVTPRFFPLTMRRGRENVVRRSAS